MAKSRAGSGIRASSIATSFADAGGLGARELPGVRRREGDERRSRAPRARLGLAVQGEQLLDLEDDQDRRAQRRYRCTVRASGLARLVLAKMLYDPPNFLVLDEPTNHLDTWPPRRDAGARPAGRLRGDDALRASHDRAFLAALSNRVLELLPEGPRVYGGGGMSSTWRSVGTRSAGVEELSFHRALQSRHAPRRFGTLRAGGAPNGTQ